MLGGERVPFFGAFDLTCREKRFGRSGSWILGTSVTLPADVRSGKNARGSVQRAVAVALTAWLVFIARQRSERLVQQLQCMISLGLRFAQVAPQEDLLPPQDYLLVQQLIDLLLTLADLNFLREVCREVSDVCDGAGLVRCDEESGNLVGAGADKLLAKLFAALRGRRIELLNQNSKFIQGPQRPRLSQTFITRFALQAFDFVFLRHAVNIDVIHGLDQVRWHSAGSCRG